MTRRAVADIDKQTLDCIRRLKTELGWAPTYQQIATCLGLKSKSPVWHRIQRLKAAGLIEQESGQPRAVRIIK